eukprot:15151693-Alexandrium_andersonii.AAC.1
MKLPQHLLHNNESSLLSGKEPVGELRKVQPMLKSITPRWCLHRLLQADRGTGSFVLIEHRAV